MADQNKARAGLFQFVFQPFDGLNVEVVGRFVQQHQFGRFGQQLGQRGAATLPARGRGNRRVELHFQPFGDTLDQIVMARFKARGCELAQCFKSGQVWMLVHISDRDTRRQNAGAGVGLDHPCHDLHQGRLARSVAPNQRNAVARLHHKVQAIKDRIAAEGQGDIVHLQKGYTCHGAGLRACAGLVKRAQQPRAKVVREQAGPRRSRPR